MRTRPMSFIFTLTLLFGVTVDRSWAEPARLPVERITSGTGATDAELAGLGAADPLKTRGADVQLGESVLGDPFGQTVDGQSELANIVNASANVSNPSGAIEAGDAVPVQVTRSASCIISVDTLPPAIANLIQATCPREMMTQQSYCSCVERYSAATSGLGGLVVQHENAMKRIGYQFLLEEWADRFGGVILTHASLAGRASGAQSTMPQSCNAERIFETLRAKFDSPSCLDGDKEAFSGALRQIFRLRDGDKSRDVFTQIRQRNTNGLIAGIETLDRFYFPPATAGSNAQPEVRNFVDCMGAADKRAYAMLPVNIPTGRFSGSVNAEEAARARGEDLDKILQTLASIKGKVNDSTSELFLKDELEQPSLRNLFKIFPGMETLLRQSNNRTMVGDLAKSLEGFVTDLRTNRIYEGLSDARRSSAIMSHMSSKVGEVQALLTRKLTEYNNTDNQLVGDIGERCDSLTEDLLSIACRPPGFLASSTFMTAAFTDAEFRGTNSRASSVGSISSCSTRATNPMSCLAFHNVQCRALRNTDALKEGIPANFSTLPNYDLSNSNDLSVIAAEANASQRILAAEEGIAHMMCAGFNDYVSREGCNDRNRGNRSYWACAADPRLLNNYLANGGDERVNNLTANSLGVRGLTTAALRGEPMVSDGMDNMFAAQETTSPGPVSVDPVSNGMRGAIASAVNQFSGTNIVSSGAPLDIDAPTSTTTAASAEVRDIQRSINAQDTQIAAVDAQIAGLGTSPEADATRRELEALRAEMKAVRDELLASRTAAEARTNGTDVAARANEEGDEAGDRKVASGSGRGGISRGPASEGFNIGSAGGRSASDAVGSSEFRQASVDSTFGSTAATRGAVIRDSQGLPSVQSADPNNRIALRVGDQSYAVKDVETVVVPAGTPANDQTIRALILQAKDRILLDAEQRAMVEIWDDNSKSSRVVYVRINGLQVEFLELNAETAMPQVRSTLADLQSRLSAGRGAASEEN